MLSSIDGVDSIITVDYDLMIGKEGLGMGGRYALGVNGKAHSTITMKNE